MKRLLILLCLFTAIGVQAQGCLKGTVTDAKTGEPLPFIDVTVFQDGKQVHHGVTDWDGLFTIKPLPEGKYDVLISFVGYLPYKKEGVKILATGFTMLDIKLTPAATWQSSVSQEPKMLPLLEYEVADSGLAMLLVRVIEGKEHTYFWSEGPRKPEHSPEGTCLNLFIMTEPRIDTTFDTVSHRYNTLYMLYNFYNVEMKEYYGQEVVIPSMPQPLNNNAPVFSFDSTSTTVEVYSTYNPQTFTDGTYGFLEYRGIIFFIQMPPEAIDTHLLRPVKNSQRNFKYAALLPWARYDPRTWTYTHQQGYWYRWRELPSGY